MSMEQDERRKGMAYNMYEYDVSSYECDVSSFSVVPAGSPSRGGDVMVHSTEIN